MFEDVAGYGPVKAEIAEVVDFLKYPAKFKQIGARIPKGVLLVGPAGHRQDAHRPRGRRRGRRAVRLGHRLRLHGDVRRRRRGPRARPLPDRPQAGARDHLRRRDRLDRPQARRRARRWPRRARADAQPDARRDGRLRGHRGHRDDGRDEPARRPRPGAAAPGPLRPPDRRAAADAGGARRDPQGPPARQEDLARRRRQRRRARHARDERRRPREPRQRGRAVRGAPRRAARARRGLRRGTRPRAHGPQARVDGAQRGGEGGHRVPRGRPRRARLRARPRRPGPQGHDPPHRHGARRDPAAPDRGAPHLQAGVHRRLHRRRARRAHRRGDRLRPRLHRRAERPGAHHRAGPADGARVGHVGAHRPDGLGLARVRCSSARTSSTPATTPTRPPASSTKRSSASSARRRPGPVGSCALHRRGLDAVAQALLEHETLDGDEVARLVDDAMGRKAGGYRKVRKADGTIIEVKAPTRRTATALQEGRRRQARRPRHRTTDCESSRASPRSGSGVAPGDAAARRARPTGRWRVVAPTNARRTTPSSSATRIIGIAAIS